jgi:hypothetical protein
MTKAVETSNAPAKVFTNKAELFGLVDLEIKEVYVPQWRMTFRVRGLMGYERDDYEMSVMDQSKKDIKVDLQNARARLVAMTVVDPDGARIFGDEDIPMLSSKSAAGLNLLYEVAKALSGIGDDDIDELLGKSRARPTSSSPSS